MVGLSIILESPLRNYSCNNNKNDAKIINKYFMNKPSPPMAGFLERCFLCNRKLLVGKDIYMYKGDIAFCSIECRYNQIRMDEEGINNNSNIGVNLEKCSLATIKGAKSSYDFSSSSSSSSSSKNNQKGTSNRNGAKVFVF